MHHPGEALDYGMVGQNSGLLSNELAPVAGVKQPGPGHEGSHQGIKDDLALKYICAAIRAGGHSGDAACAPPVGRARAAG